MAWEDRRRPSEDEDSKEPGLVLFRNESYYQVALIIFVCVWGNSPNIRYSFAVKA